MKCHANKTNTRKNSGLLLGVIIGAISTCSFSLFATSLTPDDNYLSEMDGKLAIVETTDVDNTATIAAAQATAEEALEVANEAVAMANKAKSASSTSSSSTFSIKMDCTTTKSLGGDRNTHVVTQYSTQTLTATLGNKITICDN